MTPSPTDEDYRRLLELRTGLRRFLRWSEQHAEAAGLTPAQHLEGTPHPAAPPRRQAGVAGSDRG